MKIAMLIDKLGIGGGSEYIYQLAHGMPDYEFVVFARDGNFSKLETQPNVRVVLGLVNAKRINHESPDLIHVQHLKPLLLLWLDPFIKPKAPVIMTVHGVHLRKYLSQETLHAGICFFMRSRLERWLYRLCTALVCLTPSDVEFVRTRINCETPIYLIPNGIDTKTIPTDPDSALRKRLSKFSTVFMFIGRFFYVKGLDILLNAVALAAEDLRERNDVICLIGDGELTCEIKQRAKQLQVEDIVVFVGAMPNGAAQLALADFLLAPSRYEGMPILLLEAGLVSTCVIASDCPGNRDIILNGESGRLFGVGDCHALAELLRVPPSEEDKQKYSSNLHRVVLESFNSEIMLGKTRKLYSEILEKKIK